MGESGEKCKLCYLRNLVKYLSWQDGERWGENASWWKGTRSFLPLMIGRLEWQWYHLCITGCLFVNFTVLFLLMLQACGYFDMTDGFVEGENREKEFIWNVWFELFWKQRTIHLPSSSTNRSTIDQHSLALSAITTTTWRIPPEGSSRWKEKRRETKSKRRKRIIYIALCRIFWSRGQRDDCFHCEWFPSTWIPASSWPSSSLFWQKKGHPLLDSHHHMIVCWFSWLGFDLKKPYRRLTFTFGLARSTVFSTISSLIPPVSAKIASNFIVIRSHAQKLADGDLLASFP